MDARLNAILEQLLEAPSENLKVAMIHASDVVAAALHADKVDAFIYQAEIDTLVAIGTSSQPLSQKQRRHGLHQLPISNGGRTVQVFQTGQTFVSGRIEEDREELIGIRDTLKVRSLIGVPLVFAGKRAGAMMLASLQPDFFSGEDVRFTEAVVHWVSRIGQHADLVEHLMRDAVSVGRRAAAEELVTMVAHDLRNHLAPIDLRLKLLLRRAEREQRLPDVADLSQTLRSTARLEGLINDILDVARLDRGLFSVEAAPVDLVSLVNELAGTLNTTEHPVVVKAMTQKLTVAGDAARLRQCLENLLSNAAHHSPEGAPVTVLIDEQKTSGADHARVDVIDEGPGVSPEVLPRIFDRYVTGSSRQGGLGLGLYIAKRIAEMHGGDLRVDQGASLGARFTFLIPKAA
jgi:two-component system OmpR family sensor kinase